MIIVTGMPRSGSTLMMKMLHSAGVECYGHPVTMETENAILLPDEVDWLQDVGGAVKILNIGKHYPPAGDYKFIYMTRDLDEQARSIKKYMDKLMGRPAEKGWKKRYRAKVERANREGLAKCRELGEVHVQRFEGVLTGHIDGLVDFTGLDKEALMRPVQKRTARCAEGFREKEYYETPHRIWGA